jgi:hypothetical protein
MLVFESACYFCTRIWDMAEDFYFIFSAKATGRVRDRDTFMMHGVCASPPPCCLEPHQSYRRDFFSRAISSFRTVLVAGALRGVRASLKSIYRPSNIFSFRLVLPRTSVPRRIAESNTALRIRCTPGSGWYYDGTHRSSSLLDFKALVRTRSFVTYNALIYLFILLFQ